LALKNLATVFLELGSSHYENALNCYLQAIDLDAKDSVLWNHLGTLSCSMGLLSISRWAFEQGLLCSPNNWNCMEKLLEVLIAVGDEVSCLSVANLILRHWPSHSRALHVKHCIEDTDSAPFAPKGIDKLEPQHVRLKFLGKRKVSDMNQDMDATSKKLRKRVQFKLPEASWVALLNILIGIVHPSRETVGISADIPITIELSLSTEAVMQGMKKKDHCVDSDSSNVSVKDCNIERESGGSVKEKEPVFSEEHPQERRSTRLERLRNQKPEKEGLEFDNSKDPSSDILQYLEKFVLKRGFDRESAGSFCNEESDPISEHAVVSNFVKENLENYGAYHMGHLLLEYIANKCEHVLSRETALKILELEKLTRHWGRDRKPECSLFLAELYHDFDSKRSDIPDAPSCMVEVTYHLSKIIESVSLDYAIDSTPSSRGKMFSDSSFKSFQGDEAAKEVLDYDTRSFWARYFWLSARLSILEDNKAKALEEYLRCLSLLGREGIGEAPVLIQRPHCRRVRELTINRIIHEINLLKIDFLLENNIPEMMEKEFYSECVNLLAPLLFPDKDILPAYAVKTEEGISSVELSALEVLIKACQKSKPIDVEVYMNCHRRKLQVLLDSTGTGESVVTPKTSSKNSSESWDHLVAEEVKAILLCISQVKNSLDQSGNSDDMVAPRDCVAGIQALLLRVMSNIVRHFFSKRYSDSQNADGIEEEKKSCFLDAAIGFCKLQHLDATISTKYQVELIIRLHDLLAEYGLCCAGKNCAGEEGAFLRFAIKHLLAVDMKVKSSINSPDGLGHDMGLPDKLCRNEVKSFLEEVHVEKNENNKTESKKDGSEEQVGYREKEQSEQQSKQIPEHTEEVAEEEKDELELLINNALDQCFFCLYGLNLRVDGSYEDELAVHKNTSRGDYQTKEQCVDVFQYILPYAKASSRTGLVKLRRVLRAIKKHFSQPPDDLLIGNVIDKFLDDPELCEDKLSYEAGSEGFLETITKCLIPSRTLSEYKISLLHRYVKAFLLWIPLAKNTFHSLISFS
jgi:calcineurin-binding protein cabin-1